MQPVKEENMCTKLRLPILRLKLRQNAMIKSLAYVATDYKNLNYSKKPIINVILFLVRCSISDLTIYKLNLTLYN